MYYVYEWFIVETGEVIYVGKGTNNRYRVRKHNKFFNEMIRRYHCDSRIIKEFETEKDAFAYEFERVNELKKINQCICNIYNGGYGGSTEWWTDDQKEKYSKYNVMKSESQRERMRKQNPMKKKDVAEKANKKKQISIIIGGEEFSSIKAVCEEYNVGSSTVNSWCVKGETSFGLSCYYKDDPHGVAKRHINNGKNKPLMYKGIRFESTGEFARSLGISQSTASRWCRQHRDSYGNECYFIDSENNKECHIKQKSIPIIVNGTLYPSKEEAARQLGISSYKITRYLNGKAIDTEYICEYGNQQPSPGNTDNSTPEGSTTNR